MNRRVYKRDRESKQYFSEKFHCSQAIFAAFAPNYGISAEHALKIGGCFGSGMCRGEVCGAMTGAQMVLGLAHGQSDANDLESRRSESELATRSMERFKAEFGSYICRDLLGMDVTVPEELAIIREKCLSTEFCPKLVKRAS